MHVKRWSTSLIITEVELRATVRSYLIIVRMATFRRNKQEIANVGKDGEKLEPLCTVDENVKW